MTNEEYERETKKNMQNVVILQEAIKKGRDGELKTAMDIHNWLYSQPGYTFSEDDRIRDLQLAEQITEDE